MGLVDLFEVVLGVLVDDLGDMGHESWVAREAEEATARPGRRGGYVSPVTRRWRAGEDARVA